jgi:hypothetical protein
MTTLLKGEIEYFTRDGKIAAQFEVRGNIYKVLGHKVDGKWQYYINTQNCEAVINLDEDIYSSINEYEWRPS